MPTQTRLYVRLVTALAVMFATFFGITGFSPNLNMIASYKVDVNTISFIQEKNMQVVRKHRVDEVITPFVKQWDKRFREARQFDVEFTADWLVAGQSVNEHTRRSLYFPMIGGDASVFINGVGIGHSIPSKLRAPGTGTQYGYFEIANFLYQPGINRISIILRYDGTDVGIKEFYFGPVAELNPIFILHTNWHIRQNRIILFWSVVLLISISVLFFLGMSVRVCLVIGVIDVMFLVQSYVFLQFDNESIASFMVGFSVYFCLLKILAVVLLFLLRWPVIKNGNGIEEGYYVFALVGMFFALMPSMMPNSDVNFGLVSLANLSVLPLFLCISLHGVYVHFFKNKSGALALKKMVEQKEEQLQAQLKKSAVMEERQRLTRDMHDGIGGQLLSLLVRVRGGTLGMVEIETEIQDSLNDLRLIVDAMDDNDEDLLSALAVFRIRVKAQADAAEIKLQWEQPDIIYFGKTGPRRVLHIYRLMQEAVSNVLRHSGARNLSIVLKQESAAMPLRICIFDDGKGCIANEESGRAGKGMLNMRTRAHKLGGTLTIGSGLNKTGFGLTLSLPVEALADSVDS
ncbi:MAG: hypothetical protein COA43_05605 [Robiginitomaculum sp.]|nr:MAG: hypothetical protein COA43_05605 [Robiginitomaculum sp.]